MQEERLTNEEIQSIRNRFYPAKDFLDPEFGEKFDKVFDMAKKLNNTTESLRTFDEMLSCMKDKIDKSSMEEIDGLRIYLSEVINDMI
jgi:hypothetical protein